MPPAKSERMMSSTFVSTSMGGEAYAHWVRRAIGRARAAGGRIVPLFDSSVEEPVDLLRQVVRDGFDDPITPKYQSVFVNGNPDVVNSLASRYEVAPERILTTTGATSALSIIYRAYLKPGDHILVETPGFDLFGDIGRALGAKVDPFNRRGDDFAIDEFELASQIRPNTKLIVLSDLHNPSGMLLEPEVLARLARLAGQHGARLVVDEVYGDYAGPNRVRTAAHISPNIIAVSSLTKMYGLSTLRCGWIIAAEENLWPIREWSDHFEFGVSKLSHAVAALVLEDSDRFAGYAKAVLDKARPILDAHVGQLRADGLVAGELPDFGCIFFPRLIGIANTIEFSEWLADRYGIIVAPGEFFGAPGHVRIGFAHAPEVLEFGLSRLREGLQAYSRSRQVSGAAAHA